MSLAILIPSKHRHAELAQSLPGVLAMARACDAEVVICDQSPSPFPAPAGVRLLHRPDLAGLPAARNAMLATTAAEVVLFLDDDSDPATDLGERILVLAATEPDIAAWGPVVETRPRRLRLLHRLLHPGCFRDSRRLTAQPSDAPTRELFGCCFAVRHAAAHAIGGFDARLPGYALGEDRDFCWRLVASGCRLRFCRELRAVHRAAGGGNPSLTTRLRYLRWWAARHGRGNPATPLHLALVTAAWAIATLLRPSARNE